MEKIIRNLKWIMFGQVLGVICIFIAYYIPLDKTINDTLFIFGIVCIVGYLIYLFQNVYKVLLKEEISNKK